MSKINGYLWWRSEWKVHCVHSLSMYRCWSCNWCLAPDLKGRQRERLVRDWCVVILTIWCCDWIILYTVLHYSYNCGFTLHICVSKCLHIQYLCTCNSVWAWVSINGLLNWYVAWRRGGGCGLNQEARDDFCLGAPAQSDGRVVNIRDTYTTRGADIFRVDEERKRK